MLTSATLASPTLAARSKVALDDTTFDSSGGVTHIGTNQMARYAFHLHHVIGPEGIPADGYQFTVIGNVMQNDGEPNDVKWGIVIHDSSYGLMQDNVVDNVAGAGIVTEAGTEIQNVIAHNFVAEVHGTGERVDTGGVAGVGFWLHGPDNYVRNNVSTNIRSDGYGVYTYGIRHFQLLPWREEGAGISRCRSQCSRPVDSNEYECDSSPRVQRQ